MIIMDKIGIRLNDAERSALDITWKKNSPALSRSEYIKAAVNAYAGTTIFSVNERMRESSKEAET